MSAETLRYFRRDLYKLRKTTISFQISVHTSISGVVELALSDLQGISEAFQGSMRNRVSKGGRWGNESSLNLRDNVN
jgi:hypothetical protein